MNVQSTVAVSHLATPNGRPEYLIVQAKGSLRKLGVEQIDLWQLHRIDPHVPRDEQFGAVRRLIDDGVIRHAVLSEVSVTEIEAALRVHYTLHFEPKAGFHMTTSSDNKALVLKAFDTLFNRRDYEAAARFWSPNYIQHSAHIPPGRDGLFNLVKAAPPEMRYENHLATADDNYVLLHGRFTNNGRPRAWVAGDVIRVADGIIVEHWDTLQDEVTQEESKSGLPMFGNAFSIAPSELTVELARRITAPLYEALNQPQKKDVRALLAQACHADYRSYSTNDEWLSRDALADVFKQIGVSVPDLAWSVKDIMVTGDRVIVRGEATGTPTGELWGAPPTGKSFRTIAVDVFTVRGDKLAVAYHVENWVGAMQQIR
jgi:predicted SnoaL-like aldol condensation-catalyzing enzyme/predicted ester cyclase